MHMKPFSRSRKPISRATARNAFALNQFGTPGLGSLVARRWIAGTGQLVLFLAGFTIFIVWFIKQMIQFYNQITGNAPAHPIGWIFLLGSSLCLVAWIWSLFTSLGLIRQAEKENESKSMEPQPPILNN